MRSYRGGWLRSWVLGATLVVAPAVSTTVQAQPGFGPDPFWPYNNQYTAYTTPIGPASPDAGQSSAYIGRQGFSTANQFQQYVDGMSGPGRTSSDRANVGIPYFRGSIDPAFGGADRDYRPNAGSADDFEKKQQDVTKKYFAYFSEKDPRKRAELLREYQQARRESSRELGSRSQSPSRFLSDASRTPVGSGSRTTRDEMSPPIALPHEPGTINRSATSTSRPDDVDSARLQSRTTRPAPPMPSVPPLSSGTRTRTPTGALNRALGAGDRTGGQAPGMTPATTRRRRTAPGLAPPVTNPE